jgi:hypothetical protein
MKKVTFKRAQKQNLPNLYVGTVDDKVVGFIYRPENNRTDKNAWRSYVGIGDKAQFLYHTWDINDAMEAVQLAVN